MKSYQQFFAELKRRHVFRVAAIYGAVSFVILQVADILLPALGLPEWTITFMVAILILAFPVALLLAWAFEVTPTGVRRTDHASPDELAEIVAQPAAQRWPAGLLALAGVAALVIGAWWVGRQSVPDAGNVAADDIRADASAAGPRLAYADLADDSRPSIAVLPFADMSPDGDQAYFSDGMTDEILTTLARIDELRVAGRTATFSYKSREADIRTIGEELGVRYIVDGSVRKDGEALRITASLIDTRDASQLWTESFNRTLEGVFEIQTEIASAISDALRVPLGLEDPADLVRPVADFEAYDLYLAARARMRERGGALTEAIRLYEAAIARDSTWAPAWAGLAEATEIRLWHEENFGGLYADSTQIDEGLAAAEQSARRALDLDPNHASAHVALGNVQRDRFEWAEAEASYRRALTLDPDDSEAHQQYGELLIATGRIDEAVVAAERAVALDPAPIRLNLLGLALWNDDRNAEAESVMRRLHEALPDRGGETLPRFLYVQGRFDEARDIASDLVAPPWDLSDEGWNRRVAVIRSGDAEAIPPSVRTTLDAYDWVLVGKHDSAAVHAVAPMERDLEIRRLYFIWLPIFDSIRSHPVVREYLQRANLADAVLTRTPVGRRP